MCFVEKHLKIIIEDFYLQKKIQTLIHTLPLPFLYVFKGKYVIRLQLLFFPVFRQPWLRSYPLNIYHTQLS